MGTGTSGAEIARELAATRRTFLAGRPTPHMPDPVLRYAGDAYWRFIHSALTTGSPAACRVAANFHKRGAPLIRISVKDLDRAGVVRLPRLSGTMDGQPLFDGDTSADLIAMLPSSWATLPARPGSRHRSFRSERNRKFPCKLLRRAGYVRLS